MVADVAPDGTVRKVEPVGGSPLLVQAAEEAVLNGNSLRGPSPRKLWSCTSPRKELTVQLSALICPGNPDREPEPLPICRARAWRW